MGQRLWIIKADQCLILLGKKIVFAAHFIKYLIANNTIGLPKYFSFNHKTFFRDKFWMILAKSLYKIGLTGGLLVFD